MGEELGVIQSSIPQAIVNISHSSPWRKPTAGWIRVNADGAVSSPDGSATIGGALRELPIIGRDWVVRIAHINRMGNAVVDGLARMTRGREVGEETYLQLMLVIVPLLIADQCPV
ncbi:hypothetical protein V6N12_028410 [Hibiscus sabdariffa]|uniref:RNase H type-1 domain-containing protein n=1 Tax=Hibiscus sabdariffa TaxID=183260 RepID=A0ABR2F5R5_9ROSI